MDQEKRRLRQLKRAIKRSGNKTRRQQLKRDLAVNPGNAHEAEFEFGRDSSAGLNGMDQDATRRRDSGRGLSDGSDPGK
jgi:hypothetical protein